jgi:hypothetical protein
MTTSAEAQILNLVAEMERARKSGLTNSDQRTRSHALALLDTLHEICDRAHASTAEELNSGTKLGTGDLVWVLAELAGWYIGAWAPSDTAAILSAGKFAADTVNAITATQLIVRNRKGEVK